MRILHTADWHLGRRLDGRSRHEEQVAVMDEIVKIAEEEAVDGILIAGDVFDTYNPPAESEALFYRTMTRLADGGRRAVLVIAGNHDSPDRLIASNPYARALGITTIGYPKDTPALYDAGSDRVACVESAPSFVRLRMPRSNRPLSVLALPYPSESRLRELLTVDFSDEERLSSDYNQRVSGFLEEQARRFIPGEANMVATHLFVRGGEQSDSERDVSVGGAYAVNASSFPHTAGYVALGHLHREQSMTARQETPLRYSGSILQYSFSEAGQEKSVTVVEFEGPRAAHRIIPLSAGRRLHRWTASSTAQLEERLARSTSNDWHNITLELDAPLPLDYLHTLKSRHPEIFQCLTLYNSSSDVAENRSSSALTLEEQFRAFVAMSFSEPCNESVMRLFLELAASNETQPDAEP
ncbi:MAG: exonuclease subunit SbcD [Bacteroidetes bacterium]|nr:exonuclease subunit SbcD [Bacteroidota bacterium]